MSILGTVSITGSLTGTTEYSGGISGSIPLVGELFGTAIGYRGDISGSVSIHGSILGVLGYATKQEALSNPIGTLCYNDYPVPLTDEALLFTFNNTFVEEVAGVAVEITLPTVPPVFSNSITNGPIPANNSYFLDFTAVTGGIKVVTPSLTVWRWEDDFTFDAWFLRTNAIYSQYIYYVNATLSLLLLSGGYLYFKNGFNTTWQDSLTFIPLNVWTHVALVYSASDHTWRLYINGIVDKSSNVSAYISASSNIPYVIIGGTDYNTATNKFYGSLSTFRFWNSARWTSNFADDLPGAALRSIPSIRQINFSLSEDTFAAFEVVNSTPGVKSDFTVEAGGNDIAVYIVNYLGYFIDRIDMNTFDIEGELIDYSPVSGNSFFIVVELVNYVDLRNNELQINYASVSEPILGARYPTIEQAKAYPLVLTDPQFIHPPKFNTYINLCYDAYGFKIIGEEGKTITHYFETGRINLDKYTVEIYDFEGFLIKSINNDNFRGRGEQFSIITKDTEWFIIIVHNMGAYT